MCFCESVAGITIHRPVRGDDVRIIVSASDAHRLFFFPACPRRPIAILFVRKVWKLIRSVIEHALSNAVLVRPLLVLKPTPDDAVDEPFEFCDLIRVRLKKFFHRGCDPRSTAAFITEPRDPNSMILV